MRSFFLAALVCIAGAVVIGACSSSSTPKAVADAGGGGGDTGSMTAADTGGTCAAVGTGASQYTTGNATCDSCLGANCCMAMTTCVDNAGCLAALNCTVKCVKDDGGTTDACGLMCIEMNADGGSYAVGLSTCESQNCSNEC